MAPCPRCDAQGEVVAAEVKATGQTIFVCNECEATWLSAESVGACPFVDYGTFMSEQGLEPLWSEITLL
jgi:hypothetical protein